MIVLSVSMGKAQCTIKDYSTFKNVLRVDGDFVQTYDTYRRVYKIDGPFLLAYNTYKKLLKFESGYIIRYSDFKKIVFDNFVFRMLHRLQQKLTGGW